MPHYLVANTPPSQDTLAEGKREKSGGVRGKEEETRKEEEEVMDVGKEI